VGIKRGTSSGSSVVRSIAVALAVVSIASWIAAPAGASGTGAPAARTATNTTAVTTTTTGVPVTTTPSTPGSGATDSTDVLTADRDQVLAKVSSIDRQIHDAEAATTAAQARLDAANEAAVQAAATAEAAAAAAATAADQVRSYAVEVFVRPPAQDALSTMAIKESADASYATDVLTIVAQGRGRVVDAATKAKAVADKDRGAAAAAAEAATSEVAAARTAAESLRSARAQQNRLATQLDDRLDQKLAEVAALKAVDAKAAKELADQEVALRKSVVAAPATAPAAPKAGTPVAATRPSNTPSASNPTTTTVRPSTTPSTVPTTTAPKPTTPSTGSGLVTWADVTKAGGFWVNKSIASQTAALVSAAKAAGFNLSGGGYRDPAEQIALRRAHCGTSDYAIYVMPASQCTPPTAQPGKSMHERGLAIDIQSGGHLITSRSDPAFQWLAANAASYGFYNLPSEPWHWSINGS